MRDVLIWLRLGLFGALLTTYTTRNIMMLFAMGAILFIGNWVTQYYGRIGYYYCRLPYTVCSILRTPAER